MQMTDEQAAQILTVGAAVDFVLAHEPLTADVKLLAELLDELPEDALPAGLHARLLERAAQRLLRAPGVPRRQRAGAGGDRPPLPAAGGRALRRRAADEDPRPGGVGAGLPRGRRAAGAARAAARGGAAGRARRARRRCVETERVLASVLEAVIGACYLNAGFERTAEAVVEAFAAQIERGARESRGLQVGAAGAARAARRGGQLRGHRPGGAAARPHATRSRRGWTGGARAAAAGAARSSPSRRPRGWRSSG